MKREILFRGKRVDDGEWVEGDLIHGVGFKKGNMYILPIMKNLAYAGSGCDPLGGFDVTPDTVGQFTGLTDKNGIKIFEGDILAIAQFVKFKKDYILAFEMKFEYRESNSNGWTQFNPPSEFAVIGNIHDNPELIK